MQENTQVATTPPLSGADLVAQINKALQTIATDFSGAADPAAKAWPFCTWADTGNMLLKRRNEANTAWAILGPLLRPAFPLANIPNEDIGDILVDTIGVMRWDATDSKYYRLPTYANRVVLTASGSFTTDAYTKYVRFRMIGGGGGGAYGGGNPAGGGGGGGGGGCGQFIEVYSTLSASTAYPAQIGSEGTTGTSTTNATAGGSTTFAGYTALGGDGGMRATGEFGGAGGNRGGVAGISGATSGDPPGSGGAGAASPFGPGGTGGARSGSAGSAGGSGIAPDPKSYGAGGGGGGGSRQTSSYTSGNSGRPGVLIVEY